MKPIKQHPWVRWRERRRQAVRRFAEALRPYHPLSLLESWSLRPAQDTQDAAIASPPGRALLILNPVSGLLSPTLRRRKFEQHFARCGWQFEIYETTGQEDLPALIRQKIAAGLDLLVTSGGDGTISAAATGLLGSEVPLGILPTGTGNMFARDLGIPFDLDRALELITGEHAIRRIDLMQTEGHALVMNLSIGFTAQTIRQTDRSLKRRLGIIAYVGAGAANLLGLRLQAFRLSLDGRPVRVRASELMVANSSLVGIRNLPPDIIIEPDDGFVQVCAIRARTLLDWLAVLGNIITRRPNRNPHIRCLTATRSIEIVTKRRMCVQGDGELLGETPVKITILPAALPIIVPAQRNVLWVERMRDLLNIAQGNILPPHA